MFKSYRSWVVLAAVLLSVALVLKYAEALTTSVIKSTTKANRYRVTYIDVANGTGTTLENMAGFFCKKFTLLTLGAQDQIITSVSNLVVPFQTGDTTKVVTVAAVRPIQSGVDLTGSDVIFPATLNRSAPHLENKIPDSLTYGFFSESVSTDIEVTVCGEEDLNQLAQGTIDFYVLKIQ